MECAGKGKGIFLVLGRGTQTGRGMGGDLCQTSLAKKKKGGKTVSEKEILNK